MHTDTQKPEVSVKASGSRQLSSASQPSELTGMYSADL